MSSIDSWEPRIGLKLTGGERRRVRQFLRSYGSCFAFGMHDLGTLKGPGIRIDLSVDAPIFGDLTVRHGESVDSSQVSGLTWCRASGEVIR